MEVNEPPHRKNRPFFRCINPAYIFDPQARLDMGTADATHEGWGLPQRNPS